jgi:hypothetical protein
MFEILNIVANTRPMRICLLVGVRFFTWYSEVSIKNAVSME